MKVLRIWHAAVVNEYRKKIRAIANFPDVILKLLIPGSWKEGSQWVHFNSDSAIDAGYEINTASVAHRNNIRRYYFTSQLFHLMASWRPDLIDIEEEPFAYCLGQVLLYRKWLRLNAPVIFHSAHNISSRMKFPFPQLETAAFRSCQGAVARNQETVDLLRQKGFDRPIALIGNGIDLSHFMATGSCSPNVLSWKGAQPVIGFVGKLQKSKGLFTLIRAFAQLPETVQLLLIGDGADKEALVRLASELGIEKRILFAGAVPHEQTPLYFRCMDVCVLPSETQSGWKESFGRTLIEAMACGVPVVGSSSGAIPSTIGDAGLVFPEGDSSELYKALHTLLTQESLRSSCSIKGKSRASDFTWDTVAKKNYQLYRTVLDGVWNNQR